MQIDRDIPFGALKIFSAVAEAETLTHAAQRLGITQSAVSQAIAQLEQTTTTQLVVRRSRPIKLTPSGQVLREHADAILASARRMLVAVQSAADSSLPQLSIGAIDSFGNVAGQQLIERIGSLALHVSLQTGFTAPLSQAFLNRDLDILITSDPLEQHPELERHAILRDPFVMLVADKHCVDGDVSPQSLAESLPFVRYTRRLRLGILTDLITRRLNIEPQPRFELDSTQTLMRFVQSGHGWAIATALCIVQYPELLKGVRVVPLAKSANARYVSLFARHNELGTMAEQLTTMCREICDQDILPRINEQVPWLAGQVRTITEVPII